jgi:DNA-binding transcriptional regulator YhcF (GntR family)
MPIAQRVAEELAIDESAVDRAYRRLATEAWLERDKEGVLRIASRRNDDGAQQASVGDQTQIRFEAALFRAVREAAARGLSAQEATGMFKAAMQRIVQIERSRESN